MPKIIIGFSKPKNRLPILGYVFSYAIRLIEGTKYSHVYVRWHSLGANADICYHASGSQIHFLCKDVFDKYVNPVHEYEYEITRTQYKQLLHYCMTHAGKKYGVLQVFGIAIAKLFLLFGKKIKNPFSRGDTMQVCSELVGNIYNHVLNKNLSIDLDTAGPRQIKDITEKISGMNKIK